MTARHRTMQGPQAPELAARLFGSNKERTLALMRAVWPAAVGPELARRTDVVSVDGGVLRVRVPDATWQRGLARMRSDLLRRLRAIAGSAAPRSLGFVLGGPVADPSREAPAVATSEHADGRFKASGLAPEEVRTAAESIPDAQQRERFLAVATRYLDRFAKGRREGTDG